MPDSEKDKLLRTVRWILLAPFIAGAAYLAFMGLALIYGTLAGTIAW